MTEMLPCPFCGGTVFDVIVLYVDGHVAVAVTCENEDCCAQGPAVSSASASPNEIKVREIVARDRWNQRAKVDNA